MLRLVGFFIAVLFLMQILRVLPVVGGFFHGLLGFWVTAIFLSWALNRYAGRALDRRSFQSTVRQLGAVETPHNLGKLGSMLLKQGRHKRAVEYLARAAEGEPESAEWRYRLGQARLKSGDVKGAVDAFQGGIAIDPDHGYGDMLLQAAEAHRQNGDAARALESIAIFERDHGPSPESAYRRGRALRDMGERDASRSAFAEVAKVASQQAIYQRKGATSWVTRAWLARLT